MQRAREAYDRQEYKAAMSWYQVAANQGNTDAQYWVGNLYEAGRGVSKDLAQARYWYKAAADRGDPTGKLAVSRLDRK